MKELICKANSFDDFYVFLFHSSPLLVFYENHKFRNCDNIHKKTENKVR